MSTVRDPIPQVDRIRFTQIAVAPMPNGYPLLFALDDQGNIWECRDAADWRYLVVKQHPQ